MKKVVLILALVIISASSSFASISVRAGLSGGAFKVAGAADRQLNDRFNISGELGYGIGNQYSVLVGGGSIYTYLRDVIYAGIGACYSSYSETVSLSFPTMDVTTKSGVGINAFLGMTRDKLYGQVGYDTRLGAVAEAGYLVRM
ncbi:MAG: hypothetical protein FD145_816 [Candidatus Saganbacteria bacterium]|uniref:Outer membrane protein beta-barrel domain-containing protein n=1 Tax=Candidatus Saganbacteria bacterium TaxID=2575572 RepID=A0A833L157_UNCSA|nr:MAG: hypothetical protein FD145_816 [Candidatus Saganbacteria bacterium]